jgi:hypothetical protein
MLMHGAARTQFSAEATVTTLLDDNVNNSYLQVRDKITEAGLKAGYDWETEVSNTQLFYSGSLNYFSAITDRTFQAHAFGGTYSYLFDEEKQTLLNTGATYGMRLGRGDYTIYDNTQLSLYANIKHSFAERLAGKASYSFRSVSFSELSDFNYTEHYGFIQGTFFRPTRTTLILEADIGTKIYSTPNYDSAMQQPSQGKGKGSAQHIAASTPSVTQLIGLARIGQPIMEGTGLSLTTTYQVNLQKESRYLSSEYGTISDDELFDDHYGYEGLQTSLMLTQLLPAEMQLKLIGSLQDRNYSERPAYDLNNIQTADTREDTRKVLTLQLEKRFESIGVLLGLSYDYIINSSNDVFYDYTNNALTVRLSYSY